MTGFQKNSLVGLRRRLLEMVDDLDGLIDSAAPKDDAPPLPTKPEQRKRSARYINHESITDDPTCSQCEHAHSTMRPGRRVGRKIQTWRCDYLLCAVAELGYCDGFKGRK